MTIPGNARNLPEIREEKPQEFERRSFEGSLAWFDLWGWPLYFGLFSEPSLSAVTSPAAEGGNLTIPRTPTVFSAGRGRIRDWTGPGV